MVTLLDSGASCPGSSFDRAADTLLCSWARHSHSVSLSTQAYEMGTGKVNAGGGNPAID